MMPILFYAPSMPLDDTAQPTATLLAALRQTGLGPVTVVEAERQPDLSPNLPPPGEHTVAQWVSRWRDSPPEQRPTLWITHGLSPLAPDHLGPQVSAALQIPYVISEPLVDPRVLSAADGAVIRQTLNQAAAVITTSSAAAEILTRLLSDSQRLIRLAPFLDISPFSAAQRIRASHKAVISVHLRLPPGSPWLLAMGPMTHGAALASYQLLARALARCSLLDWYLILVGDGPARDEVQAAWRPLSSSRLRIWSSITPQDRMALLVSCDLYVWPALEDHGLPALLEAQAAGLGVVACAGPGVNDRTRDGITGRLVGYGNAESFANAVSFLLRYPAFRTAYGKQAREIIGAEHTVQYAAQVLREGLRALVGRQR